MKFKDVRSSILNLLEIIERDHKKIKHFLIITSLTSSVLIYINLIYSAIILDKLISKDYRQGFSQVIIMLILNLVIGLINRACRKYLDTIGEMSQYNIEKQTTSKALEMEYEELEKRETLDSIRRTREGVSSSGGVDDQINNIAMLLENFFKMFFSFLIMIFLFMKVDSSHNNFFTSPYFTIIVVIFYILIFFICSKIIKKSNMFMNEMLHKNERINSVSGYLIDLCLNYKNGLNIRIFKMRDYLLDKLIKLLKIMNPVYLNWGIKDGKSYGFSGFLMQIGAGITYVFVGAKAICGIISVGDVLMYTGAILSFISALQEFMKLYGRVAFVGEYLNNYTEFINKPNLHYNGTLPIEKRSDNEYEFEFKDICFKYPNTDTLVLDHVNLKLNIGDKLAVVGQNGAGKTTLIKLLCRLYEPTSGEILLNGVDIRKYDYNEYTDLFSVVFQDFKLYSLPIDENIASSLEVDHNKVITSLDAIGMKDRVLRMKHKTRSKLYKDNGDGIEISGGEAQKLAIARALYKDAPFVILDEPTAALDPLSEADIYKNFNTLIKNKSAIYISHRMSSCKFCDDIVVFKEGRIIERGNHDTLLSLNGEYSNLFNSQAKYYEN